MSIAPHLQDKERIMLSRRVACRVPAFSLAELLIVLAIIVLLLGILLPALGIARRNARDIATRSQLDSIGKANESYKLAFGAYGGVLPDAYWDTVANRKVFTSNENLVLSLVGRSGLNSSGGTAIPNSAPTRYFYKDQLGSGPQTDAGQTYGAFYPAKKGEVASVSGTAGDQNDIPEFVDVSYGLPILYFRARGGWQRPATLSYGTAVSGQLGAFHLASVQDYVEVGDPDGSGGLVNPNFGSIGYSQADSLLNTTGGEGETNAVDNLAWLTINTKLSNLGAAKDSPNDTDDVPGAGFYLVASGYDRIFFAKDQGDLDGNGKIDGENGLSKFDDIIISGGTAP